MRGVFSEDVHGAAFGEILRGLMFGRSGGDNFSRGMSMESQGLSGVCVREPRTGLHASFYV